MAPTQRPRNRRRYFALHAGVLAIVAAGSFGALKTDVISTSEAPAIEHAMQAEPETSFAPFEMANLVVERLSANNDAPLLVSVSRSYPFVWPAAGPITSYMGSVHPTGIDIGLDNAIDTPIYATAGGVVTFAGGSDAESYGLHVEIDHGGGLKTLYAHLDEIGVTAGQSVQQGEILGLGGNTGKSDGKHLHFEVTDQGQRYDPLRLLPVSTSAEDQVSVDCGTSAVVVHHGSQAVFDFSVPLGLRSIGEVALQPLGDRQTTAPVWAEQESRSTVTLATQPSLGGPEERFMLTITTAEDTPAAMQCEVILKPMALSPAFYVRALEPTAVPTSTPVPVIEEELDEEVAGAEATPEPPTPTATATAAASVTVTATATATPEGSVTPTATVTPETTPVVTNTPPAASPTPEPATPTPTPPAATPTAISTQTP